MPRVCQGYAMGCGVRHASAMGLPWVAHWSETGLLWVGRGSAMGMPGMGLLRVGYVSPMGPLWVRNCTAIGLLRLRYGSAMSLPWVRLHMQWVWYGSAIGPMWVRYGYACHPLRLAAEDAPLPNMFCFVVGFLRGDDANATGKYYLDLRRPANNSSRFMRQLGRNSPIALCPTSRGRRRTAGKINRPNR